MDGNGFSTIYSLQLFTLFSHFYKTIQSEYQKQVTQITEREISNK